MEKKSKPLTNAEKQERYRRYRDAAIRWYEFQTGWKMRQVVRYLKDIEIMLNDRDVKYYMNFDDLGEDDDEWNSGKDFIDINQFRDGQNTGNGQ